MKPLLWRSMLRHLTRHPWQLGLSVLGIALGVAVVLAVDLANASARASFMLSMEQVAGRATHQISGGRQGIPETLYTRLRVDLGLRDVAPVVSAYVTVGADNAPRSDDHPGDRGELYQVLGVDPFAEAPFLGYLDELSEAGVDLNAFLTRSGAALLSRTLGRSVEVAAGSTRMTLHAVGWLQSPALQHLIVTDIGTAQDLFGKAGRLDRIDLILPEDAQGERLAQSIRALLPDGFKLERTATRNQATVDLSAAFSLNLTAMSLLALVVGMFLIYNTMTFSVVQRRGLLGMLRALGADRRELFSVVLGEALLLGLAGILLGALLGLWIGSGLVHLVTRAVNDLYFTLNVREYFVTPLSLLKAGGMGLLVTLIAAWLPAREAAAAPPGAVLSRAALEARWRAALPRLSLFGLLLLLLGFVLLGFSSGLLAGFVGLFLLILGCALLTPVFMVALVRVNQGLIRGLPARMATRDVARHLSRTGVAVAALMVAFAATVGVGVMIDSFRGGVAIWITDLVNADLYIAPIALESGDDTQTLNPAVVAGLRTASGVAAVSVYRRNSVEIGGRPVTLLAVELAPRAKTGYRLVEGDPETAWRAFEQASAVMISEPLAYRQGLRAGSRITLPTAHGNRTFPVVGVFLDYGSEHGRILMQRGTYQDAWDDKAISTAALYALPGVDLARLREELLSCVGAVQPLWLRSNRDIRKFTLTVFDRTFTVTRVLRLLAILVAFVGVVSALMALQLERAREFAILRATGMTAGEVGWLVSLQTGFMGFAAGLMAIPVGLLLAAVLIFVINRRAFGWTLPFQVDPWILAEAVLLAIIAALLAGLYPLWRMARTPPAQALRSE
ncbi:MAG: ABC transporter permease [Gammaproteobacteria bacterium]|nr:ABC transporter permease [Gammaproteobacteria bacterium]MCP5424035.1 ABC transporter permease [Gammaproteobacteria bacterium]MCP5459531.1 ABC transporter permease [Gammaproteobacteria bacterium]